MKKTIFLISFSVLWITAFAQDPKFSQYFASPLSLNPANTGFFDGEYRFALNTRQQWGNLGDPYNTYSASADVKLVQDENFTNSVFSVGLSGLFDESFNKALKSQYLSASVSYYQYLDGNHQFKFGIAPQISYVSKYLDYNKLTFASQYSDGDFNMALPNYLDLKNDKTRYFDLNFGANFSATFDQASFVVGVSLYHITKPSESLFKNSSEIVPYRKTVNFGMFYNINNNLDMNVSGIYTKQKVNTDTMLGTVLGFRMNDDNRVKLNAGLWYKFNESSVFPYLGVTMGNLTAGVNYTVYSNRENNATPRTYEISLIYRQNNFKGYKVSCPKF
ncbi:type IX secretion system membrane protein PorP/SprF [Pedobacter changchengzhani]|uniref:Type IX secretion system membrane protein PorP/SprF n=1 Tax=Pedobacter changchengzhani TaxID=2529274 RepID=A0A4R5MJ71_9SPHI|nr:PorP/SprF family type IX secretion system membrane protein [Pedobacter changchengzhani]TDG35664.1 type IX secretion system membrane protein PorP/SprF [Pedobacter changchengzhani]